MQFTQAALATIFAFLSTSSAAPTLVQRQTAITDPNLIVAQFALTLEHLENVFYKEALSRWSVDDFTADNFTAEFYDQLKYVAHDEEGHVVALEAIITQAGGNPVQACTYKFPMGSPADFVKLASVVEGVGVSAYIGAAPLLTNKYYLTAAATILATEALHQSAQRNAVGEIPMANIFATPLGVNAVFSIASQFITSCPPTNDILPVKAYPLLTLNSGLPTASGAMPGAEIDVVPATMPTGSYYGTFVSGLDSIAVAPSHTDGNQIFFVVPENIGGGQSYVFITSDNSGNVTDANVLAGPAIIEITPNAPTFNLTIQ